MITLVILYVVALVRTGGDNDIDGSGNAHFLPDRRLLPVVNL